MNTLLARRLLFCLSLMLTSAVALAQPINQLGNPGFESPAFGKETNFSLAYPWQNDGVNYVDSGFEPTGAHSGTYRAFEMSGDDGAYQISNYQLQNGDLVTLSWWAQGTYNGTSTTFTGTGTNDPLQTVGLFKTATTGDAFNITTPLVVTNGGLPGTQAGWVQYTMTYTAGPSDVGEYVGAYFNTETVVGDTSNSYAAYDDFYLGILPAGSVPSIVTGPASQTAYTGATVTFNVSAIGATGYQWEAGAVGSGVYTNLLNSGQFSGVSTSTLTITNVTPTNNEDFVVVVSNGSGSVTSTPPATLTVATILYQETFNLPAIHGTYPDQPITAVGWMNDITSSFGGRVFTGNQGYTAPNMAVYSFDGSAATEAFYGTTASINGGPYPDGSNPAVSNRPPFTGVNLQVATNISFVMGANGSFNGNIITNYIMVQMNFGQWYISTSFFVPPADTTTRNYTFLFTPTASAWNLLTVSGHGSDSSSYTPLIGGPATSDLTGYITGIGWVCAHGGSSTANMDTFTVTAAIPPSTLPQINSPPFSTTNYTGTATQFAVTATSNGVTTGLTYQWKAGTVGSGIYAPLSINPQISSVTNSTLVISNVTAAANHKDYVVVVTDGAGSVTSVPPATLTVVDSAPSLGSGATVYPDNATGFSSTNYTLEAGNNNVMSFTASFIGDLPITYQWQFSLTNDGTGLVPISNATNSIYTLSNPQTANSGYYRLQAANSQSITPTNSGWAQLTVLPAADAVIKWSAAVSINGMTETQILGLPGTFFEAESFYGATIVNITNGGTVYTFDNTGAVIGTSVDVRQITGGYTGPSTGDTNFDAILGTQVENIGGSTVTLNNLIIGTNYSVQLFALNDTAGFARQVSFSNQGDAADVSPSFTVGDNVYVAGVFTATNTTQTVVENEAAGNGYIGTVIVRSLSAAPSLSIQNVGSSLQVTYTGTLLQATSVNGPWTTNSSPSPATVTPTGPSMFFRSRSP